MGKESSDQQINPPGDNVDERKTASLPSQSQINTVTQQTTPVMERRPRMSRYGKRFRLLGAVLLIAAVGTIGTFVALTNRPAPPKVYKIGILDGLHVFFGDTVVGFKQKMTELGYVEGKNVIYDIRITKSPVGNESVLKKFVQDKVDLIVSMPTEPSLEAKAATKGTHIPIIALDASTEGSNLVDSVQRPGHNVTGVRFPGPEDTVKRLDILHQLDPQATRVLVPYLKDYPNVPGQLSVLQTRANTLGITLILTPVTAETVGAYVASLPSGKPGFDAVLCVADPFAVTPTLNEDVFNYADQHNLPIIASTVTNDGSGPLVSLTPDKAGVGKLGAPMADKILRGADPATLPMATPQSELQISLKVATRLGITPSPALLSTATKIIR